MCNIIHLNPYILITRNYLELPLSYESNRKISIQINKKRQISYNCLRFLQKTSSKYSLLCSNCSSAFHPNTQDDNHMYEETALVKEGTPAAPVQKGLYQA